MLIRPCSSNICLKIKIFDSILVFSFQTIDSAISFFRILQRVVEHNIRIMATYYTRITLKRMAQLLFLTESETEDFLSAMVVNKTVEAKTDRLDGVVNFVKHQDPNDMLNNWSHSISELLSLVMKTTHLVNKEEMVHKHLLGGGSGATNPKPDN